MCHAVKKAESYEIEVLSAFIITTFFIVLITLTILFQARKLKYKLEDVRRRGRRDEVGKVDGELGRSEQATGRTEVEKLGRTEQVGRSDGEKVKEEQQEQEEEEREERSEVTQVLDIFGIFVLKFVTSQLFSG